MMGRDPRSPCDDQTARRQAQAPLSTGTEQESRQARQAEKFTKFTKFVSSRRQLRMSGAKMLVLIHATST